MHLRRKSSRDFLWKLINLGVIAAIVLGAILPATAQAASAAPGQINATCERAASGSRMFLPLISSAAQSVAADLQAAVFNPLAVERKLKYEVGKTYVYAYDVTVVTKSSSRNSNSADVVENDQNKTVMAAQAEVSITGQESDGTFAGQIVMKLPFVCTTDLKAGQESILDTSALATELLKPLIFKQKSNGVVASVSYPAEASVTAVNMQKGVINALQTMLQDGADTYKAPEVGGQGTYTATYTLQEQANKLNISKSYDESDYSKINKQGDAIKSLKMTSALTSVLDGAKGVLSSVESTESLVTGDGAAEPNAYTDSDVKFDGVTSWSTVNSTGKLNLTEVKTSTNLQAAALNEAYVEGGLEPIYGTPETNQGGIDLSTINLTQEIATFEADPTNPDKFGRILDLVAADTAEVVVDKIIERLNANVGNDTIAKAYIDILTVIATPKAQKAMTSVLQPGIGAAGISATMSITSQQQALIDLVRIQTPISTTVDTVAQLSNDTANPLQNTAVSVLGATINNLKDEDPNKAQALANTLVGNLSKAPVQDKEMYLNALGNAGVPSTLSEISQYTDLSNTEVLSGTKVVTEAVEASAYYALRKIPGKQTEDLLVAGLNDTTQPNSTRLLIANVLSDRPDLSSAALSTVTSFKEVADLAGSGTYARYWGTWLGNSNLGVNFPGSFTVSSINQLYLYADQQANGYVWGNRFSLARGQLVSNRYFPNPAYQFVGAYLDVAGNRITQFQEYILCNTSRSGNLWANNWRWSQRISIPIVWVITIDVDVRVTVNVAVDYAYSLNVCNVNNAAMSAGVTPRAGVGVVAEASLNLRLARGGVGISATIMNTYLPTTLSLSFNGSTFRFCSDVHVTTNPLSGYIYAFADVGVDVFFYSYWKRIYSGNLASFNVGSYTYNVLVQCW